MTTQVELLTFPTLFHILGVFYAKSLATRLPISQVDFTKSSSNDLSRVELPTFPTLFYILGVLYATCKSPATRLPVTWVDTYHSLDDSTLWGYIGQPSDTVGWSIKQLPSVLFAVLEIEGLCAKRAYMYIKFWPICIFCRIELVFGRLTCFDMKSIIP